MFAGVKLLKNRVRQEPVAQNDPPPTPAPEPAKGPPVVKDPPVVQPPPKDPPSVVEEKKEPPTKPPRRLPLPPSGNPPVGTLVGKRAPDVSAEDLNGETFKLSDHRGKVVLLFFWGDWCPYCRHSFPYLKELGLKMEGRDFVILGVNNDPAKSEALRGLQREKVKWSSWYDGLKGPIAQQWRITGFPEFILIDANGIVRKRVHGFDAPALKALIPESEELLEEIAQDKR